MMGHAIAVANIGGFHNSGFRRRGGRWRSGGFELNLTRLAR
jgi:hypothetical protein